MKLKPLIAPLALLAAGILAAFSPALTAGFVKYDDPVLVTGNPAIRDLSPAKAAALFTTFHMHLYHPLVSLSYALEYAAFGQDPLPYHLDNVLIHLANAWLVFALFRLLTRRTLTALLVALLFALHPLHVEPVAWVSARKDLLYSFFFLAGMLSYVLFRRTGARRWYGATAAAFLCSLLSKPMGVTLPAALFLLDMFFFRTGVRRALKAQLPLLLAALAGGAVALVGMRGGQPPGGTVDLLDPLYNLLFYLWKTVWPAGLSLLYPRLHEAYPGLAWALPFVCAALLAALWASRSRVAWFGALFYVVTLLPVLQIVPFGLGTPADRYTYLPLLGIFLIAARAATLAGDRLKSRRAAFVAWAAALAVVLATLGILTYRRAAVWKDTLTLSDDVLAKYPDNGIALRQRAYEYVLAGNAQAGMADMARAIALDPGNPLLYLDRANLSAILRDWPAVMADLNRSILIRPTVKAHRARVATALVMGDREAARRSLLKLKNSGYPVDPLQWRAAFGEPPR